jgi:hypothetical protein
MQTEIERLVEFGPLPSEHGATVEQVQQIETLLSGVTKPLSNEEARALVTLFGIDGCFGLASTILHLVETAPD